MPQQIDSGKSNQHMIWLGDWLLIHYLDMPSQLFIIVVDPGELMCHAHDVACQAIRAELTARVLAGWDVQAIAAKMAALHADNALLRQWARQTNSLNAHRRNLRPEMDFLG